MFQGRLNESGTEMVGNVFRGGGSGIAMLNRAQYRPEVTPPETAYAFSAKTDLQGRWTTEIDANLLTITTDGKLKKIPLDLEIAKADDGTYSAALVVPLAELFGAGDPIPATNFQYPLPNVHLAWRWLRAVFNGKLADGKLSGQWNEAGQSFAVTFERRRQ